MKEKRYGSLKGLTVPVLVFASYEEADSEAGKPFACLDSSNDNAHYRGGPAADTRDFICSLLEDKALKYKKSGSVTLDGDSYTWSEGETISRFTKTVKKGDKEVTSYVESEGAFADRVCGDQGWEDLKAFQPDVDAWAAEAEKTYDEKDKDKVLSSSPLRISLKQSERKSTPPPKLPKDILEKATSIVSAGQERFEKVNHAVVKDLKDATAVPWTGDAEVDSKALGWLIKKHIAWKMSQAVAKY